VFHGIALLISGLPGLLIDRHWFIIMLAPVLAGIINVLLDKDFAQPGIKR